MTNARGPLPKATSCRGVKRDANGTTKAEIVPVAVTRHPSPTPKPPSDLSASGLETWADAWALPWTAAADRGAILTLARLEDERALLLAAVEKHGAVISKVLVSPRGDVVGSELYPNPAHRELRRVDTAILALRDRLGLTPLYRARLGLALVAIEEKENAIVKGLRERYRTFAEDEK